MPTKYQDLQACIEEAGRFLRIARELKESPVTHGGSGERTTVMGPKRAATLRASLDLSKALSRLRQYKA